MSRINWGSNPRRSACESHTLQLSYLAHLINECLYECYTEDAHNILITLHCRWKLNGQSRQIHYEWMKPCLSEKFTQTMCTVHCMTSSKQSDSWSHSYCMTIVCCSSCAAAKVGGANNMFYLWWQNDHCIVFSECKPVERFILLWKVYVID